MNKKDKKNISNSEKALPSGKGLGWASNIFFIGIGGIGMSALARYFVANGKHVAGYDKTPSDITTSLQKLGVEVHFNDSISEVKPEFLDNETTLVVYTLQQFQKVIPS